MLVLEMFNLFPIFYPLETARSNPFHPIGWHILKLSAVQILQSD